MLLAITTAASWAANLGVTSWHTFTNNADGSKTITSGTYSNGTVYDQLKSTGPDGVIVYGPLILHKNLTNQATPKIGECTPGGGGGSGGGGGGNKGQGTLGAENGVTYQGIDTFTGKVTTVFVTDPWTCGTIFYDVSAGIWHYRSQTTFPCPNASPIPSSSLLAPPFKWVPAWKDQ